MPIGDSPSASATDLSRFGSLSSRDEIRRENLPPSLRSSNSRLDIYVAPYETTRSVNSNMSADGILNDFAELRVDQGNRRQSMPVRGFIRFRLLFISRSTYRHSQATIFQDQRLLWHQLRSILRILVEGIVNTSRHIRTVEVIPTTTILGDRSHTITTQLHCQTRTNRCMNFQPLRPLRTSTDIGRAIVCRQHPQDLCPCHNHPDLCL